jgi:hypothetical protein
LQGCCSISRQPSSPYDATTATAIFVLNLFLGWTSSDGLLHGSERTPTTASRPRREATAMTRQWLDYNIAYLAGISGRMAGGLPERDEGFLIDLFEAERRIQESLNKAGPELRTLSRLTPLQPG